MPPDGWVCFHCGERFKTVGGAQVHFERRPSSTAGCLIKAGEERGLLMEVRRLEAALRELIDNACRVCDQTLLSRRALADHQWLAHRIRGWGQNALPSAYRPRCCRVRAGRKKASD